ncbi:hypothetical protein BH11PSE10_BH11PSE10_06280 [soil metagenome]
MKAFPKLLPAVLFSLSLGLSCLSAAAERELTQQLGLSAEQSARVDEVLRRGQQRHDEVREQTRMELSALLSPTQLAQLERLMPPVPPPHPPHTHPAPPAPPAPPALPDRNTR